MPLNEYYASFENQDVIFDGENNFVHLKKKGVTISFTEHQGRLIYQLLIGVTRKAEIMKFVWGENYSFITDNNYHQLLYQCRTLFVRHGMKPELIKTIPRHGVKFNYALLQSEEHKGQSRGLIQNQHVFSEWITKKGKTFPFVISLTAISAIASACFYWGM